jgi:hypothetical protein
LIHVKLTDFGLARITNNSVTSNSNQPTLWTDFEGLTKTSYSKRSDVWYKIRATRLTLIQVVWGDDVGNFFEWRSAVRRNYRPLGAFEKRKKISQTFGM